MNSQPTFSFRLRQPFVSALAAGLLLAAAGAGCTTNSSTTSSNATSTSSPATGSVVASAAFFTGRSTFDFVPDPTLGAAGAVSNRPYWAKRIRDTIGADLTKKGYRRVKGGSPNMLIAFHVIRQEGDATSIASNYQGYKLSAEQKAQANMAQIIPPNGSGTLVIDVIDPAKKEIILRTSKQTSISNLDTADAREKALGGIVEDALSSIPAKS
jgi:hypothetical protein